VDAARDHCALCGKDFRPDDELLIGTFQVDSQNPSVLWIWGMHLACGRRVAADPDLFDVVVIAAEAEYPRFLASLPVAGSA
jgi:hypothetical protein